MVKDFLTIVIPTKNESELIDVTLDHLNKQHNINGTKVIICDCSSVGQCALIKIKSFIPHNIKINEC